MGVRFRNNRCSTRPQHLPDEFLVGQHTWVTSGAPPRSAATRGCGSVGNYTWRFEFQSSASNSGGDGSGSCAPRFLDRDPSWSCAGEPAPSLLAKADHGRRKLTRMNS